MRKCKVEGCKKGWHCKDFCQKHYLQNYRKNPKNLEKHLARERSPAGRKINRRAVRKYIASEKGKRTRSIYQSGKGRQSHVKANKIYRYSFNGQIKRKLWGKNLFKSEEIKATDAFKNFKGRCDCCKSEYPGVRGWCLDHKNRRFRGFICMFCNFAAGLLQDSVKRCYLLISYLKKAQK